jgi:hypothetical protein
MKTIKFLSLIFLGAIIMGSCGTQNDKPEFTSLFNGEDLTGWETYIGVPKASVDVPGLEKDTTGNYVAPIGFNKDPLGIFQVVTEDGVPAVKVSGQVNGSLATTDEFENYHYRMQVKWGEKKWYDREDALRNSGLLYHGTGEYGVGLGVWKQSHECQVMETMFGDSYRMGDTFCSIRASKPEGGNRYVYDPNAELVEFGQDKQGGKICSKNATNEKPRGEWNTVEIFCVGAKSVHVINGVVNMVNEDSHLLVNGQKKPLTKGNIQLQSEGAEVFFRNMEIREIDEIPEAYLK